MMLADSFANTMKSMALTAGARSGILHFDPGEELGVVHDTLKHVLHNAGTVETEFWLCGQGGWFYQHRPHASDLAYQMRSGDFLSQAEKAPPTRALAEGLVRYLGKYSLKFESSLPLFKAMNS